MIALVVLLTNYFVSVFAIKSLKAYVAPLLGN